MEVCEHGIHYLEGVTGINKNVGLAGSRYHAPCVGGGGIFQGSDRRGTNGDYAAVSVQGSVDLGSCMGRDGVRLGMQFVFFDTLCSYRLKGSQAHMQRDLGGIDAALPEAGKNFGGEMEAGRGSRHGTALLRVDRLIAFAVAAFAVKSSIGPGNVGWKGNVSDLLDGREEICDWQEADSSFTKGAACDHLGPEL